MDGEKQHRRAEHPQVRHAGQPFLRQDQPHQRLPGAGDPDHQRRHQVGAGHNGPSGHGLHPGLLLLLPAHGRQQHAVDGGVHVGGDHLGKLAAPVAEGQVLRRVDPPDNQLPDLPVYRVQQRRKQQLPSVGKQGLQPGQGEHPLRMPFHRDGQDHRVRQHVEQLLPHQGPYPQALQRHGDAHRRRSQGSPQGGEEEFPELHVPGNPRLVHVLDPGDHHLQPQHPQHRAKQLLPVEGGDQRRREVQHAVQHHAPAYVEPEHAGEVQLVRVLLLDQGVPQPAVHKNVQDGDEHRHHGDEPVLLRQQDPRQHQLHQQLHALGAYPFRQPPQEVLHHRRANRFCFLHFRILRTASFTALKGPGAKVRSRSSPRHSRLWSS